MKPRKFHIWQFPEDKVRVLFKKHNGFINNAINFFGSQKALSNFLGINYQLIYNWKEYHLYIPLKYIKKIVKKCNLDWNNVEKQIISYKGINTSSPIFNPKLPIKETPEIFALITHIICDGSVNKNGIPYYINSSKELIDNFDEILRYTFGDINKKLSFGHGIRKNCYNYRFSKIIIELLEHFYDLRLYRKKKLPKEIFELPKEFSISVIRAFGDDEGNVDLNRRIGFYSTQKDLLVTLIELLKDKLSLTDLTEIREKAKGYYYFYINPGNVTKYEEQIGFNHPLKKERLRDIVKFRKERNKLGMHGKIGETRERLLNLLFNKVLSTYDLMKELRINKSNINIQIKKLRDQNLIVQHHKTGQTVFWTRRK